MLKRSDVFISRKLFRSNALSFCSRSPTFSNRAQEHAYSKNSFARAERSDRAESCSVIANRYIFDRLFCLFLPRAWFLSCVKTVPFSTRRTSYSRSIKQEERERRRKTKEEKSLPKSTTLHRVLSYSCFHERAIVGCSVELSRQNGVSNLRNRSKQGKLALFSNRANCLHLRQVQFFV